MIEPVGASVNVSSVEPESTNTYWLGGDDCRSSELSVDGSVFCELNVLINAV